MSSVRPPSERPSAPPGDAPPQRNATETKKRLLDAAEAEFAAKGFAGARLRDVAAAALVQQALIHRYFGDKEGRYRAVLERAIAETAEGSWDILGRVSEIRPLLEAFVDLLLGFYASHANLLAILRMEAASGSSVAVDLMRDRIKPVFAAVEALLLRWQREGAVRADLAASDLLVAILGLTLFPFQEARLLSALSVGTASSIEERKHAIVTLVLEGALPR